MFNFIRVPLVEISRRFALLCQYSSFRYRFLSPFHLVTFSPWPFLISAFIFSVIVSLVAFLHGFEEYGLLLKLSLIGFILCFLRWIRDVVYEGSVQGYHTEVVQQGLRLGFILFIVSEIMFFFAFFWAFFHSSLSPALEVGCGWPPVRGAWPLFSNYGIIVYTAVIGLEFFEPWFVPFLNTLLLLSSGVWLTFSHSMLQRSSTVGGLFDHFFYVGLRPLQYRYLLVSVKDCLSYVPNRVIFIFFVYVAPIFIFYCLRLFIRWLTLLFQAKLKIPLEPPMDFF